MQPFAIIIDKKSLNTKNKSIKIIDTKIMLCENNGVKSDEHKK